MRVLRVVFAAFLLTFFTPLLPKAQSAVMHAHYINVGQGDATLLEFSCGAVLIDAGGQDQESTDSLVGYLESFFQRRADLNRTLNSVMITHTHLDHNRALRRIVETFHVQRYVHNGVFSGSGRHNARWIRDHGNENGRQIAMRAVSDNEITNLPQKRGLRDGVIDPINCQTIDPQIRVLSGRIDVNPGWTSGDFQDGNNKSIVIRVDFGRASFLFTGDLEEPAIETMVDWYRETDTLDVDVYQVGHHGSHNGTTASLMNAMTPEIAVISVGNWTFGHPATDSADNPFTTFRFGHPRRSTVELLSLGMNRRRSRPITVNVAYRSRNFQHMRVTKAIYATGWDGTVKVRAADTGQYRVTRTER